MEKATTMSKVSWNLGAIRGLLRSLAVRGELDQMTMQSIDRHLKRADHAMKVGDVKALRKEISAVASTLLRGR